MHKIIVKNATANKELLWRSIKIKKSLDEICHTLELEIPPSERTKVKRHNRIEVRCHNPLVNDSGGLRLVTTVLVDEITASADVAKHCVTVVGRSPARDIIDSTWSDWNDVFDEVHNTERTLKQIARQIGQRFNINCHTMEHEGVDDPTSAVPCFAFENESPWGKLMDEADSQGFIFTSNEAGGLHLLRVQGGDREEPFHITEGVNVKNIKWTENGSEQFHEYVVKGGGREARLYDNTCPGSRILTIDLADPFDFYSELEIEQKLKRRAETEINRRREQKIVVTVPGWGLTDGQIKSMRTTERLDIYWWPNLLIPVSMPSLEIDAKLLIAEVEHTATADSASSDITLVNRGKYL